MENLLLHHVATGLDGLLLGPPLSWAFFAFSLLYKTKIRIKKLFGGNATTRHYLLLHCSAPAGEQNEAKFFLPHQTVLISFHTFASSLWEWWCLIHGFPHLPHCHHSPDSAARMGWRSLANPNWCPKTGLSLWKRHCEKRKWFTTCVKEGTLRVSPTLGCTLDTSFEELQDLHYP